MGGTIKVSAKIIEAQVIRKTLERGKRENIGEWKGEALCIEHVVDIGIE